MPAVNRFFDQVLVMAEDETLQRNRLVCCGVSPPWQAAWPTYRAPKGLIRANIPPGDALAPPLMSSRGGARIFFSTSRPQYTLCGWSFS
jgi:hypothetical protein